MGPAEVTIVPSGEIPVAKKIAVVVLGFGAAMSSALVSAVEAAIRANQSMVVIRREDLETEQGEIQVTDNLGHQHTFKIRVHDFKERLEDIVLPNIKYAVADATPVQKPQKFHSKQTLPKRTTHANRNKYQRRILRRRQ